MLSILAVTGAPRNGLPASSVTTPVILPSEAAATIPLGRTASQRAKLTHGTANSPTHTISFCFLISPFLFPSAQNHFPRDETNKKLIAHLQLNRNFQFRPLASASYASAALDTTQYRGAP